MEEDIPHDDEYTNRTMNFFRQYSNISSSSLINDSTHESDMESRYRVPMVRNTSHISIRDNETDVSVEDTNGVDTARLEALLNSAAAAKDADINASTIPMDSSRITLSNKPDSGTDYISNTTDLTCDIRKVRNKRKNAKRKEKKKAKKMVRREARERNPDRFLFEDELKGIEDIEQNFDEDTRNTFTEELYIGDPLEYTNVMRIGFIQPLISQVKSAFRKFVKREIRHLYHDESSIINVVCQNDNTITNDLILKRYDHLLTSNQRYLTLCSDRLSYFPTTKYCYLSFFTFKLDDGSRAFLTDKLFERKHTISLRELISSTWMGNQKTSQRLLINTCSSDILKKEINNPFPLKNLMPQIS